MQGLRVENTTCEENSDILLDNLLTTQNVETYDYIVVGLGSSSSVLSYVLGKDQNITTLVLEFGSNELQNPEILNPYGAFTLENRPDIVNSNLSNTNFTSYSTRLELKSGSTWGGGSSVNYQVYSRGGESYWKKLETFNPVFGYNFLLQNFWKKTENYSCNQTEIDTNLHGLNGNYYQHIAKNTPLTQPLAQAFKNVMNLDYDTDCNGLRENGTFSIAENQDVFCSSPTIFQRSTMSLGYLQNIVQKNGDHKNPYKLTIKSRCFVDKLKYDPKSQKIIGVYYIYENKRFYVQANKMVILGAGSLRTPNILERSGIGNPEILEKLSIPVNISNKNVGENLKIQYGFSSVFTISKDIWNKIEAGPENFFGTSIIAYFSNTNLPRKCYFHILKGILSPQPYIQEQIENSFDPEKEGPLTILCWNLQPETSGSVHITGQNVNSPFSLTYNAYNDSKDLETGRYMLNIIPQILSDLQKNDSNIQPKLIFPSSTIYSSDKEMDNFLKASTYISYHYYSTCQMAFQSENGVVDQNCMVFGTKNLMICDGSVIMNQALDAGPSGQLSAFGYGCANIIYNNFADGNISI